LFIFQKLGTGLRAAAKSQINLMMTESPGVKQAEGINYDRRYEFYKHFSKKLPFFAQANFFQTFIVILVFEKNANFSA
jgi:hypothetical protein